MTGPVYDEDKSAWAQNAAIPDLVNAVGTGDGTIVTVTATPTQAAIENNFRDVSDKVNTILAALRQSGIIAND